MKRSFIGFILGFLIMSFLELMGNKVTDIKTWIIFLIILVVIVIPISISEFILKVRIKKS
jgi:hypothetical protein